MSARIRSTIFAAAGALLALAATATPAAAAGCGPTLLGEWQMMKGGDTWTFTSDGMLKMMEQDGAATAGGPHRFRCVPGKSALVDVVYGDGHQCAYAIRSLNPTTIELIGSCGTHFLQKNQG